MRVYMIGRGYQSTDIDTGEAASRFLAWLADEANPALTQLIQSWLMLPADSGGLGALADSATEVAQLRVAVAAAWQQTRRRDIPERRPAP